MSLFIYGLAAGYGACRTIDEFFKRDWRRVAFNGFVVVLAVIFAITS